MSERIALIIHNNYYLDTELARLPTPDPNIRNLISVLHDPEIGNFDHLEKITNGSSEEILQQVKTLFHRRKRYDVLLLYISGHMLLDARGQLYLAGANTRLPYIDDTAIPIAALTAWMDRSFSRRQIILLDCHHSLLKQPPAARDAYDLGLAEAFAGRGRGRVVITATDAICDVLPIQSGVVSLESSTFTRHLTEGLLTGSADQDQDGQVDLQELFDYVEKQMRGTLYKPRKWSYHEPDRFIIARTPPKDEEERRVKWNLIFGGTFSPLVTLIIGGPANLLMSIGMASLFALLYIFLYSILD